MNERHRQLLIQFGLGEEDARAWESSGLPAGAFDAWLTDRVARRPAGARARRIYGAPDVHDFARRAILDALSLTADDRLLEIGCGGGLLLRDALATGAQVTGLDHSHEMVALARRSAPGATVVLAGAEQLPFSGGAFTAVAMSIVFQFLERPADVLRECRRVLVPGGCVAVYTVSPKLRGTPAAPEPLAAQTHMYEDRELADLARQARLTEPSVADHDGGQLLTARARNGL